MIRNIIKKIFVFVFYLTIDPRKLKYLPLYLRQRNEWLRKGGKIDSNLIILNDYNDNAGSIKQIRSQYFHQDLLVATKIAERKPNRHIDIGSRIDGFVAHVASFREIEVIDIRPLNLPEHQNIKFIQKDFMKSCNLGLTDSLSCLHAIEHFGLGRYSDPIDVNGHIKGLINLISLLEVGGYFYLGCPIAKKENICFNAHRIFDPIKILEIRCIKENLFLENFDFIDDKGNLSYDINPEDISSDTKYGCGIFTFVKT